MNTDIEMCIFKNLNFVLPVYICIPQMRPALLCPTLQDRYRTLCPHQVSNTCNISLLLFESVIRCNPGVEIRVASVLSLSAECHGMITAYTIIFITMIKGAQYSFFFY